MPHYSPSTNKAFFKWPTVWLNEPTLSSFLENQFQFFVETDGNLFNHWLLSPQIVSYIRAVCGDSNEAIKQQRITVLEF